MRNVLWVCLAALAVASCGDCGGGTGTSQGEITVEEVALDFGASCPKPSDPKYEVTFPTQTVHVHNAGTALSNVNAFEVEAAYADVFVLDAAKVPATVLAGDAVEVPITFKPNKSGTVIAKLTIQGDRPNDEDKHVLTLSGEGKNFDPVPKLATSCQSSNTTAPTMDGCNPSSASVPKTIRFIPTPALGYVDVPVTLKNGGCPTLKVQSVTVATTSSDDGKDGFALAPDQATALTVLGGNAEPAVVTVRFTPQAAGSIYKGTLTFETNDPAAPTVTIALDGEGTAASLYLDKTLCNFSPLTAPCNGLFTIRNSGGKDLTLSKVSLQNANPLFTIENADAFANKVVPKSSSFPTQIKVNYVPGLTIGSDFLVVDSDAGSAKAELRGGSPPKLKTTPAATLNFGTGLDHVDYYSELEVENVSTYNQQLDLTVKDLKITDTRKVFDVVKATPPADCPNAQAFAANTKVKPGEKLTACVHFKSDLQGGNFASNLNVLTDDPTYPDPNGLLLQLTAQATCQAEPFALAEVRAQGAGSTCPCTEACPATSNCSAKLPAAGQGMVDVSGESSYSQVFDFDPQGQCIEKSRTAATKYEWTLVSPTDNSASINPSGLTTAGVTTLSYSKTGAHIIKLKVYDARNVASNAVNYTVFISQ